MFMQRLPRRQFLQSGALLGATLLTAKSAVFGQSTNETLNVGIVGCGTRGREHINTFGKVRGVRIAGICDPDRKRLDETSSLASDAKPWIDMREMFASPAIDAVVIANCNHWHVLSAIWALEAGKHVYIEKPMSLTHWEGQQLVKAAKKFGHIVQVGTQQRSDPMQAELREYLHNRHELGKVEWVLVNRYGPRGSIGLRETPLKPPTTVDYNLWLGPAEDLPIYRKSLHYDWHWDWNTGSGEMGNWGIHVLDDVRNVVFQDKVTMPERIVAAGERVAWHDAGNTPNLQFAVLMAGAIPVVVSLCNLADEQIDKSLLGTQGPPTGYVVFCENGRLEGERGKAQVFDKQGNSIRTFKGDTGERIHRQNFVDAVRANDPSLLNTPVEMGHHSTAWCNLTNIATHLSHDGAATSIDDLSRRMELPAIAQVFHHMRGIVEKHGSSGKNFHLGPVLVFDPEAERFTGDSAEAANSKLRRNTREPFAFPDDMAH